MSEKWENYDRLNEQLAAAQAELDAKGRIGRLIAGRALGRKVTGLDIARSEAFKDAVVDGSPELDYERRMMDALGSARS